MERACFEAVDAARRAGNAVARVVDLDSGADCLLIEGTLSGALDLGAEERTALDAMLRRGAGGLLTVPGTEARRLVQIWQRPLRLVIAGAVHTAQALARIGAGAGFAVHVVDPRPGFCNEARFPGVMTHPGDPGEVLAALAPDARTAVVTLAHDPRIDDPVLRAALASNAFYVGALGSRRNHGKRVGRLREAGFTPAQIARIHAPVGLNLGGRQPEEIAVAVMAEIVQVRNRA